jgi:hypothetical protein
MIILELESNKDEGGTLIEKIFKKLLGKNQRGQLAVLKLRVKKFDENSL